MSQQKLICSKLVDTYLRSLDDRFKYYFLLSDVPSRYAAVAALAHPLFKNNWLPSLQENQSSTALRLFTAAVSLEMTDLMSSSLNISKPSSSTSVFFNFGQQKKNPTFLNSTFLNSTVSDDMEVLRYFEDLDTSTESLRRIPAIGRVFRKYNTRLLSSGPVETLFSWATITNRPKCNKCTDANFQKRVILKANSKIFRSIEQ